MKIAVDLTPLYNRKITGVEVYGIEMYEALMKTKEEIIPVFRKQNTIDSNPNAIIIDVEDRIIVENFLLPQTLRKLKVDVALFPIFPPPLTIYWRVEFKIILTIHDLAFKYFSSTLSFGAKYYLTPKYNLALKHADKILTISKTVKAELKLLTDKPVINLENNISGAYQGAASKINPALLGKWNLHQKDYFISVSTIEPRKNFKYLLKIYEKLYQSNPETKLVLVGRKGWGNDHELKLLINRLSNSLIFTDFISPEELMTLYHYAKAFFLLSIYEGFGRTPLEAIACGCKHIFVSDIPVFRETMNGVAEFLPLHSIDKCIDIITSYNFDGGLGRKTDNLPFNVLETNVVKNINQIR